MHIGITKFNLIFIPCGLSQQNTKKQNLFSWLFDALSTTLNNPSEKNSFSAIFTQHTNYTFLRPPPSKTKHTQGWKQEGRALSDTKRCQQIDVLLCKRDTTALVCSPIQPAGTNGKGGKTPLPPSPEE
ncbi:hypothetical protein CDAR_430611 [Caerostris darwini]|uniref:Uncharacterized protein n=1 Tax=Caerostris darwini TaxID=1538125 RepID=A0AAV4Q5C4_9ARAC|nr:hypothetical protein CDAR_430611 [Caerostris darwini]